MRRKQEGGGHVHRDMPSLPSASFRKHHMDSRRDLIFAFYCLCGLLVPNSGTARPQRRCEFPAVFNFGDSNSDTGGLSAAFGQVPQPYGMTFFGSPAGRYSDGRLIVDFLAESLHLPYLSAYVDSIGADFSHGANFASAGSTILMPNTSVFLTNRSPFYLHVQTSEFAQFISRSLAIRNKGGVWKDLLPKENSFSRALYTFDIGQNDLTRALLQNYSSNQVRSLVTNLVDKFATSIKIVYELGGRTFWIHGTSPLGCLPYMLVRVPPSSTADLDQFGCSIPHNEVAKYFDAKLRARVVCLRKEMPSAAFTFVDLYSAKYSLITHASKNGFEKPFKSCCGYGGGKYNFRNDVRCGTNASVNGRVAAVSRSCKHPERRISWDGIHFTDAANEWVFKQISSGKYSEPPLPVSMACRRE